MAATQITSAIEKMKQAGYTTGSIMALLEQDSRRETKEATTERIAAMDDVTFLNTIVAIIRATEGQNVKVIQEPVEKPGLPTDAVLQTGTLGSNNTIIRACTPERTEQDTITVFASWMRKAKANKGIVAYQENLSQSMRDLITNNIKAVQAHQPERITILEPETIAEYMIQHHIGVSATPFFCYQTNLESRNTPEQRKKENTEMIDEIRALIYHTPPEVIKEMTERLDELRKQPEGIDPMQRRAG